MAMTPKCPKCEGTSFEMTEVKVQNARYRHNAIVCRSCGTIVGTEEWLSVMSMLDKLGEKLGVRFDS